MSTVQRTCRGFECVGKVFDSGQSVLAGLLAELCERVRANTRLACELVFIALQQVCDLSRPLIERTCTSHTRDEASLDLNRVMVRACSPSN